MAEGRCEARTMYRGTGPVTHEIRCDLHAGHAGAHELRSRSGGGVVTTWPARGDSADVIRRPEACPTCDSLVPWITPGHRCFNSWHHARTTEPTTEETQ